MRNHDVATYDRLVITIGGHVRAGRDWTIEVQYDHFVLVLDLDPELVSRRLFAALLTVIFHELGHSIGLADDYSNPLLDETMNGWFTVGTRREPSTSDIDVLFGDEHELNVLLLGH